jgi:hypothetical protein
MKFRYIFFFVISVTLPIWIDLIVSPTFWASIPYGNKYTGMIKIILAILTFIILFTIGRGRK